MSRLRVVTNRLGYPICVLTSKVCHKHRSTAAKAASKIEMYDKAKKRKRPHIAIFHCRICDH